VRVEQMNMALQTLGPMLQQVAAGGNPAPMNALLSSWADANDIDVTNYLLPPPPPPAPPGAVASPPTPGPAAGPPEQPPPPGA
jgi:hypothetical protein